MKNQRMKEMLLQVSKKAGALALAAALVLGGGTYVYNVQNPVPELVTFVDEDGTVEIEEDETPLAGSKVTKSVKTTKKTKKITLKKASTRTYTQKGKTTKKKTTKNTKTSTSKTTTVTETATTITNNYKKGSKINTQVTTVKTTITKTVTPIEKQSPTTPVKNGEVAIATIAPKADKKVLNAFTKLGFKAVINSSVTYSGLCDTRTRTLTLKKADATVYHELGHFVAFVAGNVDTTASFNQVFQEEKSKYTAFNKAYVLQNSSEYFAESFRNYTENPSALKASRPKTYAAIQSALAKITDAQIERILRVYGAIWK